MSKKKSISNLGRKSLISEWTQGQGLEKVCKWAKLGLSKKQIASNIGISESTFYEWCNKKKEFSEAIKKARCIPELELENAMFDSALGKTYVEETKTILDPTTGKVVRIERSKKQLPPNVTAQIFLAKNWMPNKYRDKIETILTEEKVEIIDDVPKIEVESHAKEFE